MQASGIACEGFAQFGNPEVLVVKGFTRVQGGDGRLAYERRGHFVRLAEPERQDAFAPHARIGDLADFRLRERAHRVARHG